MARGGWAGHVVDLVHLQKNRRRDVVPDQFEVGTAEQVRDVGLLAGKKIIQADHVMTGIYQAFADVGPKKTSTASNKNALDHQVGRFQCGVRWCQKGSLRSGVCRRQGFSSQYSHMPFLRIRGNRQIAHSPPIPNRPIIVINPNSASYRVEIAKEAFSFAAAHFITFAGDICERIHGHNYGVRVVVEGPLDENRYVVDFIALRDAVLEVTSQLDHHVLLPTDHREIRITSDDRETTARFRDRRWVFPNEDCVLLPVINTTAEEIARVILDKVRQSTGDKFGEAISMIEVAVDENHGQWGVCREPW